MAKTVTVTTIKKSIRTALAALGTTPNQIAASLKRRKITGVTTQSEKCVLANYIGKKCPTARGVSVGGGEVDFLFNGETHSLTIARRFNEFIGNFDNDRYPDLIAA